MNILTRTMKEAVATANHGHVAHLLCTTVDGQTFLAPVKLHVGERGRISYEKTKYGTAPLALTRRGRLVFALPSGGEVLG